jgi:hypothetical protein
MQPQINTASFCCQRKSDLQVTTCQRGAYNHDVPLTRNIVAIVLIAILVVTVIVPIVAVELWTVVADVAITDARENAPRTSSQREPFIAQSPLRGPPVARV